MTACPTLVTERLILRPFEESDLDDLARMMMTPEVRHSLRLPDGFGRYDAWLGMVQWRGQWELRGSGHFALEERSTGRLLGRAGLHRPEREDWPGLEVGWTLDPRQWGHGYATEAGSGAVAYAFEVMGVGELFSVILPDNTRSQRVAARLGFTLVEERVLSSFPAEPHGIWRLERDRWDRSPRGGPRDDPGGPL
jgi:RimJ/RimL family protein N-acetyltransferase